MPDRWFRIPETGTGDPSNNDAYRPKYVRSEVEAWSGQKQHPNGSPVWVVRAFGTSTQLNNLASKSDVVELSQSDAKQALDKIFGVSRTASEWEARLFVES